MTGSLDMARVAAQTYRAEVATAAHLITECAARVDEALNQISAEGLLGSSSNIHIMATRSHLARARLLFTQAADETRASREPMAQLVRRLG